MRLWHTNLLPVLPNLMIQSQWRELIAIKRKIDKCGTPQHRLVNKVLDYSIEEFKAYTLLIFKEYCNRGFNPNKKLLDELLTWECNLFGSIDSYLIGWHNDRYMSQCLYNLQEKADCGIVTQLEWQEILKQFGFFIYN